MRTWIAIAAACACSGVFAADPIATGLTPGYTFAEYTGSAPVGIGAVDVNSTLFFIDEKTVIDAKSYLIFFDPAMPQRVTATLTFSAPITAVYTTRADLDATTPFYGAPGVSYGSRTATGLEFGDSISVAPGSNTLVLSWTTLDPGDHIRVLTALPAVPEPSTQAILAAGLLVMGYVARRRRG